MHRIVAAIPVVIVTAGLLATGCGESSPSEQDSSAIAPTATSTVETPFATPTMAAAPSGALIFRAGGNGRYDVIRVDADSRNPINLTATGDPAFIGSPSPDGSRIALTRGNRVMLMNPDGSNLVDLAAGSFVSWSPDGSLILYGNFGESFGEWSVMNRDGTGANVVVPRCSPCWSPQWLPDSRTLVAELPLDSNPQTKVGLRMIGLDGAVRRELPGTPQNSRDFAVSPDGRQVAFSTGFIAVTNAIDVVSVDGTGLRTVWRGSEPHALAWSPDSTQLAFSAEHVQQPGDASPPPLRWELVVLDVLSGGSRVIDGASGLDAIAWSPNGELLAYSAARDLAGRHTQVFTIDVAGGAPTNVSNGPWYDGSPRWSSDGRQIFFGSNRASRDGVYWLDPAAPESHLVQSLDPSGLASDEQPSPTATGGCVKPPLLPGEDDVIGCLSPDRQFRSAVIDEGVVVTRIADGSNIGAEGLGAQQAPPAWSPDGTRVAFIGTSDNENWLYVFEPSTGEATRLVRADARANSTPSILWAADGKTIYYTRGGYCTGGCTAGYMYRVAADGSGEEKLTDLRVLTLYGFAP